MKDIINVIEREREYVLEKYKSEMIERIYLKNRTIYSSF